MTVEQMKYPGDPERLIPTGIREEMAQQMAAQAEERIAGLIGTGVRQEANPTRQMAAGDELDRLTQYAVKSETHLWLVMLTHKASDAFLDHHDDPDPANMPMLDLDTLVGLPALLCYVCEEPYSARERRRRCKGEPALSVKRGER